MNRSLTALALLVAGAIFCGCGQVTPKQVRIESSSIASTATEGQTLASEYGKERLGWTFARTQLQNLSAQASGPATALAAGPAAPGVAALAASAQATALDVARELNRLAARGRVDPIREHAEHELARLSQQASEIADRAEAIELDEGRDQR